MMQLELSPEERDELIQVLDAYLSDLRMEIVDTDNHAYKEGLKHEKHVLADLLTRLKATTTA